MFEYLSDLVTRVHEQNRITARAAARSVDEGEKEYTKYAQLAIRLWRLRMYAVRLLHKAVADGCDVAVARAACRIAAVWGEREPGDYVSPEDVNVEYIVHTFTDICCDWEEDCRQRWLDLMNTLRRCRRFK